MSELAIYFLMQDSFMDKKTLIQIVNDLIKRLQSQVSVISVYAYGSQARGDAQYGSDLDLLVLLKEVSSYNKKVVRNEAWELSLEREIVISVVVVGEEEFYSPVFNASGLVRSIKQEGIEIAA
jgi:predicted nucleotidyltransferase